MSTPSVQVPDVGGASVHPGVKICGLTRLVDGELAAAAGADYLGIIASPGFGRSADPSLGARLAERTGLPVVAVTVDAGFDELRRVAGEARASVLQLHGDEPPERLVRLREAGDWKLWKAVRVRTPGEVRDALARFGTVADGLLLDGWHPESRGGAGVRFPWDLVAPLREEFPPGLTFVAAGGLNPENVAEAVRRLRPHVVDVSSGVEEAPGLKDAEGVRRFVASAKMEAG